MFLRLGFLSWLFVVGVFGQAISGPKTIECPSASRQDDRVVCHAIEPSASAEKFTLATVHVDLNGDGNKELVAWESSWAGSSGGGLWIFSRSGRRPKQLTAAEMTWSPIILLRSKHHGWSDIAYYQTGGGLDDMFLILRHNGKRVQTNRQCK
jgi:hypothetical protein